MTPRQLTSPPHSFALTGSTGWVYEGSKWGISGALATTGGIVAWSFADLELTAELSRLYGGYPSMTVPMATWERSEIRSAFDTWEAVCNIDFVETSDSTSSDIRIGKNSIDGNGRILAEATYWQTDTATGGRLEAATVVFDVGDQQTASDALSSATGLLSTAIHEIGHTMGLGHSPNPGTIMYPYYNGLTALAGEDILGAQAIYGLPATQNGGNQGPAADSLYADAVQTMFIAYFGRPAAPAGLTYYANLLELANGDYAALLDDFWNSDEAQNVYGQSGIEGKINTVFNFLFGRDAMLDGLSYWTRMISGGQVSLPQAAYVIAQNNAPTDASALSNKLTAANAFTSALDTPAEIQAYAGSISLGRDWLDSVTADTATLNAALASIESIVQVIGSSAAASPLAAPGNLDLIYETAVAGNFSLDMPQIVGFEMQNYG